MSRLNLPKVKYEQVILKLPVGNKQELDISIAKSGFRSRSAFFWHLYQQYRKEELKGRS